MSLEELKGLDVELLPEREAMSLINANLFVPINAAIAANVLSDGSAALAGANQNAAAQQGQFLSNLLGGTGTGG